MTQPTNMLVNGDNPGAVYTIDLNEILSAHTTDFAGTTAPSSPVANMLWQDTSEDPPRFWRRNSTNSAWDNMGRFSNGTYDGNVTGSASSCNTLTTPRAIAVSNDATGSASFNGSADANISLTLKTVNSNPGTFGSATQVARPTVNAKGLVTGVVNQSITFPVVSFNGRTGALDLTSSDVFNVLPVKTGKQQQCLALNSAATAFEWTQFFRPGLVQTIDTPETRTTSTYTLQETDHRKIIVIAAQGGSVLITLPVLTPGFTCKLLLDWTIPGQIVLSGGATVYGISPAGAAVTPGVLADVTCLGGGVWVSTLFQPM